MKLLLLLLLLLLPLPPPSGATLLLGPSMLVLALEKVGIFSSKISVSEDLS
jgi:hypothetical protein